MRKICVLCKKRGLWKSNLSISRVLVLNQSPINTIPLITRLSWDPKFVLCGDPLYLFHSNYPPRHNHLLQAKNDIRYDSLMPLPLGIFVSLHLEFQPNFPLLQRNVIGHFPNPRVLILFQNENILFHRHLSNLPDICNNELFNLEKWIVFKSINDN